MFRNILLGFAALAIVGAAAFAVNSLASTAAGAAPFNHDRHHNWRPAVRFYGLGIGYNECHVRRIVHTPFGPRVRVVNICF